MSKKLVCAECKKEIPLGCMAVSYENEFFDNYQCVAIFHRVQLDGSSLSSIMDKSTLKTIVKE
jgi:hypothetical protein